MYSGADTCRSLMFVMNLFYDFYFILLYRAHPLVDMYSVRIKERSDLPLLSVILLWQTSPN
jgi:hypothetical protein